MTVDRAIEPADARLAGATAWDAEADDVLVCRALRDETHDVRTFVLSPRTPQRFAHRPGQFMTFAVEIGGETIHRCYTLASRADAAGYGVDHGEARRGRPRVELAARSI